MNSTLTEDTEIVIDAGQIKTWNDVDWHSQTIGSTGISTYINTTATTVCPQCKLEYSIGIGHSCPVLIAETTSVRLITVEKKMEEILLALEEIKSVLLMDKIDQIYP